MSSSIRTRITDEAKVSSILEAIWLNQGFGSKEDFIQDNTWRVYEYQDAEDLEALEGQDCYIDGNHVAFF